MQNIAPTGIQGDKTNKDKRKLLSRAGPLESEMYLMLVNVLFLSFLNFLPTESKLLSDSCGASITQQHNAKIIRASNGSNGLGSDSVSGVN